MDRELATGESVSLKKTLFEKCYTEYEFSKLLEAAMTSRKRTERLRSYCLIGLGGWCSCRTSEALGLRGEDVISTRILKIVTLKKRKSDKGIVRVVPIHRELFLMLAQYVRENNIGKKDRLFSMSKEAVAYRMKVICKNAGVPYKGYKGLRHRFLSHFAHRFQVPELAGMSGHKDPRMLMIYYHADPEKLKKIYDNAENQ